MAGHAFNFEGGEELKQMGATWFVSYSFYLYKDKSHINWKNISTINLRKKVFDRTKTYHKFWLQQVLNMNDKKLNTNEIDLKAKETKEMAKVLLNHGGQCKVPDNQIAKEKIIKWSREYTMNHHKIISILLMANDGLDFNDFVDIISKVKISNNPDGAIRSLMSDTGNNYGKIFMKKDNKIKIIPEYLEIIKENWYK